ASRCSPPAPTRCGRSPSWASASWRSAPLHCSSRWSPPTSGSRSASARSRPAQGSSSPGGMVAKRIPAAKAATARKLDEEPSTASSGARALGAITGSATAPLALDRVIHEHVRLAIVSALAVNDVLTFNDLKQLLDVSDGNLSVHARKL